MALKPMMMPSNGPKKAMKCIRERNFPGVVSSSRKTCEGTLASVDPNERRSPPKN
jgi:hypothetical protein